MPQGRLPKQALLAKVVQSITIWII